MKPGAVDNRKTLALARLIQDGSCPSSPAAQAAGHLAALWAWAWGRTDDGDLSLFDAHDIASAAKWRGDADAFVAMLVEVGYLDRHRGRLVLHDAEEHRPDYVRKRVAERQKRAASRGLAGGVPARVPERIPECVAERVTGGGGNERRNKSRPYSPPSVSASALASDPDPVRSESERQIAAPEDPFPAEAEDPGAGLRDELPDAGPLTDPLAETLRELRAIRAEAGLLLDREDDRRLRVKLADLRSLGQLAKAPPAFREFHASDEDFVRKSGFSVAVFCAQFSSFDAKAWAAKRKAGPRAGTIAPAFAAVMSRVRESIGARSWAQYFAACDVLAEADGVLTVVAPSDAARDWLAKQFVPIVQEAADDLAPGFRVDVRAMQGAAR